MINLSKLHLWLNVFYITQFLCVCIYVGMVLLFFVVVILRGKHSHSTVNTNSYGKDHVSEI